jgi:acetyltransferase-like isoleucine patch superfamily enzyme
MEIVAVGPLRDIVVESFRGNPLVTVVTTDHADDLPETTLKVFAAYEPRRTRMRETNELPQYKELPMPVLHPTTNLADVRVGRFSIIGRNCTIARGVAISDNTVIGDNVTIEEGVEIADHCSIGDNVVLKANTKVDAYSIINQGATVSGHVGMFSTVRSNHAFEGVVPNFVTVPPYKKHNGLVDYAGSLAKTLNINKHQLIYTVNESAAIGLLNDFVTMKYKKKFNYICTDFGRKTLVQSSGLRGHDLFMVPHFWYWHAMSMHYQQFAPRDNTIFVMNVPFGQFDPNNIKYYIDNCRYPVILDATCASLGYIYDQLLEACPNLIGCVVSFHEKLPWGSTSSMAGCIMRTSDATMMQPYMIAHASDYLATPGMIQSAFENMKTYLEVGVKRQGRLQKRIKEYIKTKAHVQLYSIVKNLKLDSDSDDDMPQMNDIWSHVVVATQYPMIDKLILDLGGQMEWLPLMTRTKRVNNCYNKHVAVLPFNEDVFRKIDAIDHFMKMRHATIEMSPKSGTTWYVMIATYQRPNGSSPELLRKVVESYRESARKAGSTIRFVVVGDCYEDRTEFDALMAELEIDLYENLEEPGERGKMATQRQMWRAQGSTAWNRAIDIIDDLERDPDPNIWVVHGDDDDCIDIEFFTEHENALKDPYISEGVLVEHLFTNFVNSKGSFGCDGHPIMRFVDIPMVTCVHPRGSWRLKGLMAGFRYDKTRKLAADTQFTIELTKRADGIIRSRYVNKELYYYVPATAAKKLQEEDPDDPFEIRPINELEVLTVV